jgi:protein TonB
MRRELLLAALLSVLTHWALTHVAWPARPSMSASHPARELEVAIVQPTPPKPETTGVDAPKSPAPESLPRVEPAPRTIAKEKPDPEPVATPKSSPENQPRPEIKALPKSQVASKARPSHDDVSQSSVSSTFAKIPNDPPADHGSSGRFSSPGPQLVRHAPPDKADRGPALQKAVPRYDANPPPLYPELARRRAYEGTVLLHVRVRDDGRVEGVKVERTSGYRILDRAAREAVSHWRFIPGRRGDEAVAMDVRVPITFKLR